jgi:hypothetical protein
MVLTLDDIYMMAAGGRGSARARRFLRTKNHRTEFYEQAQIDVYIQKALGNTNSYCYKFNKYILRHPSIFHRVPAGIKYLVGWDDFGAVDPHIPHFFKMPAVKDLLDHWTIKNPNWDK